LSYQVLALATGKTQQEIAAACKGARPNHVGAAIARHKRAGRIEERDGKLSPGSRPGRSKARQSDSSIKRPAPGTPEGVPGRPTFDMRFYRDAGMQPKRRECVRR